MTTSPGRCELALAEEHDVRWPEVAERDALATAPSSTSSASTTARRSRASSFPKRARRTICISTQAGCPLEVRLLPDRRRRLPAQPRRGRDPRPGRDGHGGAPRTAHPHRAWNVVVMGMGEPLLNYDATVAALRILMDPDGFAVSPEKLTLSTVGILPALEKLAKEPVRPNLAISLHAPTRSCAGRSCRSRPSTRSTRSSRPRSAIRSRAAGPSPTSTCCSAASTTARHTRASWRGCSRARASRST